MLTAYGIETKLNNNARVLIVMKVATVLTAYGIETGPATAISLSFLVATVLTAYGIET